MGARAKQTLRERGHHREAPAEPSRLWKASLLAFGVTWLAALVRWWPLTHFPIWGSDAGEHAFLLDTSMATGGIMPDPYLGWGGGYPDFRGMYTLAAMFSHYSGIDPFLCLSIVIPAAASLTALFAFVITLRLSNSIRAATLAGAIVATAMPETYAGSHAMQGALGGMLALAIVASVVLSARAPAMRLVLFALILALVPTHHLSAFLAAAMLGVSALVVARMAPADLVRSRLVDACLFGACSLLVLSGLFWVAGAPQFRALVLDHTSPLLARVLPGVMVGASAVLAVLAWYFETLPRALERFRAIADERRTMKAFGYAAGATGLAVLILGTVGVPGTSASVPFSVALPFVPLALTLAAVCAGPGRLAPVRSSLLPLGATLGVMASAVFGLLFLPTVLFPYRHLQYFVDVVAPLSAVALTFAARALVVQALPERPRMQRGAATALLSVLVLACAFTAYPSKQAVVGFQEGTTMSELSAVVWLDADVPTTLVATDHRLSSILFGFAHHDATWEAGGRILTAVGENATRAALDSVQSPRGANGTRVVLLSTDIREGAALSQWDPATPLTPQSLAKFDRPPFVRAFDNGDAVAYWVAW